MRWVSPVQQQSAKVVTIQSTGSERGVNAQGGQIPEELRDNPLFKRFFENVPEGHQDAPSGQHKIGTGSGVIVDASGIILTNNHVVNGAEKLLVKLHDGREFEAIDWKTDPKSDIAVVRIQSPGSLPSASIGNSDSMEIGDWVIAVGAPFGLDETVTAGIISAKSRGIGINTAISSTSGGYQGVGFAVPVNLARWVGDQLMAHGTVQRAFLGVGVQSVNNALSKQLGLTTVKGAVVTDIRAGSPAAKAGLLSGDVVLEFDGTAISKPADLQARVERASLKDTHQLMIIRDGKTMSLAVRVEALPTTAFAVEPARVDTPTQSDFNGIGLQLTDLTSDVANQLGMEGVSGVVITGVK